MGHKSHDEFLAATLPALDLVYNLARRVVGGPYDVEDLVQETYLKAYEAWRDGRKPRKVEPWIATICLNTGRSWLRRASTTREVPSEEQPAPSVADVESDALSNIRRDALHEAMWMLPEEQRVAIALMDLDGFTASEVARITGAPRGTVLARVHRGRKKLARMLEKEVIDSEA
jgi:RNA polymerase sigma-70 factor (ECF subfamily)